MTFHEYSWPFLDVLSSCLPAIVNQRFLSIKHFFSPVNMKDQQFIYSYREGRNNLTINSISSSQRNCSAVKESQMPFKPHPTLLCVTHIMKMIIWGSSWQTHLSHHTWTGTSAEGWVWVHQEQPAGNGALGAQEDLCMSKPGKSLCSTSLPHLAQTQAKPKCLLKKSNQCI